MDCPRCDGPLESYALRGRQAAVCPDCGWVGIDVALSDAEPAASTEPWDDALERVSERYATVERSHAALPPVDPPGADDGADPTPAEHTEPAERTDPSPTADAPSGDAEGIERVDGIDADEADALREAGVDTVDDLAAADPLDLADGTGLSERRAGTLVRKASIRLVTGGSEP